MKILLVHNKFRWLQPITWLSLFIRIFTCSKWNHIAIEHEGEVIESIGQGVTVKPSHHWLSYSDRIVQELYITGNESRLKGLQGKPYGLFDLLRIGWYLIRVRWFGLELSKAPHNSRGYVCSELAAVILGLENPHLITPADFEYMNLPKGNLYHTSKKAAAGVICGPVN